LVIGHRQLAFSTAALSDFYPWADPFVLVSPPGFDSSVAVRGDVDRGRHTGVGDDDERRGTAALAPR
jgi:hypothetical protein